MSLKLSVYVYLFLRVEILYHLRNNGCPHAAPVSLGRAHGEIHDIPNGDRARRESARPHRESLSNVGLA